MMKMLLAASALLVLLCRAEFPVAQTSKELFEELRDAGGVHPLAQLVCFPAVGQGQDRTFVLVGFSKDFASTLRAKAKPVPTEFLLAEKAPEKDRMLLEWAFQNGVALQKDPEQLNAVAGSKGAMWSVEWKQRSTRFTLRMVFNLAGRYSRDVMVDDVVNTSVYGHCEPID